MKRLPRDDRIHLAAAEGWLGLGDYLAANEELDKITPMFRADPQVLEVRAKIFAAGKNWDGVRAIAETLTDQLPRYSAGWLLLAEAEHNSGDTESAYETLVSVGEEFAENCEVTYALAVYATLTGQYMEAEDWLSRALDVGGPKLKLKALDDENLKEFWARIGSR